MPAQPLSSKRKIGGISYGSIVIQSRPTLAPYIADVVAQSSMMEHLWANILVTTAQSEAKAVLAMHSALSSATAQRAIFKALASLKLPAEDMDLVETIDRAVAPARSIRNKFCHQLWGTATELPDALLLMDPITFTEQHIRGRAPAEVQDAETEVLDISRIYVYREEEMKDAVAEVSEAVNITMRLEMILGMPSGLASDGRNLREVQRQQLLSVPLVVRALQPQGRKTPK